MNIAPIGWILAVGAAAPLVRAEIPVSRPVLGHWSDRRLATTFDNPLIEFGGHVKGRSDADTDVFFWDSFGRVRFDRDDDASPVISYRLLTADFGFTVPDLPNGMNDISLQAAATVGRFGDWNLNLAAGAGYAGDTPFGDGDAVYGLGHVWAERAIDEHHRLAVGLDYDGNNLWMPDVPLPAVGYSYTDEHLSWTVGYPVNRVEYHPDDRWTLAASYVAPLNAEARFSYRIGDGWSLYAQASEFHQGFHFAGDPTDRHIDRWFHQMRRVEAGVRLIHGQWIDAALGVGYAFDQTLSRGFDVRNDDEVASFSDRPYIGLMLRGTF